MSEKILLIDGHSILNRAFYGLPDLTNAEGKHTNAVLGFLNIMLRYVEEEKPTHLLVAFDRKEPTFRHIKYKEYKGIRKESLRDNMTDIEVALTDLGEIATRELAKEHKPYGLKENRKIAKLGGHAAKVARDDIEKNLGKSVISRTNALKYKYLEDNKLSKEKILKDKDEKKLK